jgi:hypothetical protein
LDVIAGATISVATVGDAGSSKSWRTSLTNVECQSPVMTNGLLNRVASMSSSRR